MTVLTQRSFPQLDRPLSLTSEQITFYQENGFIRLKDVLDADLLTHYRELITDAVRQWSAQAFIGQLRADCGDAFANRMTDLLRNKSPAPANDIYAQAFTQRMNLWRQHPAIATLVRSKRLATLAADLMQVSGVRLYHDQALFKEARGGYTPWHVDQFYWPLSSSNTITLWLPLQGVSADMGPLAFAAGSHRAMPEQAVNLAISEQSEQQLGQLMQDFDYVEAPFELGEVSFHSGWTCHRANSNSTTTTRAAFTIIYMQDSICMITPQHRNHAMDAKMWLPGIRAGQPAASPINPVLFSRN
jgi:ectoine hydroxylase-related dioxygenase (phytanoyl-CoA dioxygenase family)